MASPTPFELLGGEAGVRRLVDRFYDHMEDLPEARRIRAMHPADLSESREKLWMFLVGRLGGPPLYVQAHGHPRLRARHMPFPIAQAEADAWMACMRLALAEEVQQPDLRAALEEFFHQVARFMRNRGPSEVPPGGG